MCAWQYKRVTAAPPPAHSHLGPLVHREPEGQWEGAGGLGYFREGVRATGVLGPWGKTRTSQAGVDEAHVLMFPLMCWYLGRQGSSGNGSWENTESSPEEQELRVSGKLGEYCSVGAHRSRYSCRHRQRQMRHLFGHIIHTLRRSGRHLGLTGGQLKSTSFPEDGTMY